MFEPSSRILVVDDMKTMRKLVQNACKTMGYSNFVEAEDGNLAWEALTNAHPPIDVVISDWNMPNCSGLEFLKKVRASEKFKHLPFVLLTAEAESSQVKEALLAGVDNYVVKPFAPNVLKEKLEVVYKKRGGKKAA